jgi:uncharacterized CHY-type Zn-finger protein
MKEEICVKSNDPSFQVHHHTAGDSIKASKNTWSRGDIITCIHCEKEFQLDEYYMYETGDEIECQKCEKTMYIVAKDTSIEFLLSENKEMS